jgi:hypothetical protein
MLPPRVKARVRRVLVLLPEVKARVRRVLVLLPEVKARVRRVLVLLPEVKAKEGLAATGVESLLQLQRLIVRYVHMWMQQLTPCAVPQVANRLESSNQHLPIYNTTSSNGRQRQVAPVLVLLSEQLTVQVICDQNGSTSIQSAAQAMQKSFGGSAVSLQSVSANQTTPVGLAHYFHHSRRRAQEQKTVVCDSASTQQVVLAEHKLPSGSNRSRMLMQMKM